MLCLWECSCRTSCHPAWRWGTPRELVGCDYRSDRALGMWRTGISVKTVVKTLCQLFLPQQLWSICWSVTIFKANSRTCVCYCVFSAGKVFSCQELSGRCSHMKFLVLPGPALLLTSDNIKQRLGSAALDRYLPSLLPTKKCRRMLCWSYKYTMFWNKIPCSNINCAFSSSCLRKQCFKSICFKCEWFFPISLVQLEKLNIYIYSYQVGIVCSFLGMLWKFSITASSFLCVYI